MTTTRYHVETYGGDGVHADPEAREHGSIDEALADATARLGRPVVLPGDWRPDADMAGAGIPEGARPVGAWHESDVEGCGGVSIWTTGEARAQFEARIRD
jgi:hypothetical protein